MIYFFSRFFTKLNDFNSDNMTYPATTEHIINAIIYNNTLEIKSS